MAAITVDVLSVSLQGEVGPAGPPGVPGSVVSHSWWDPCTHKVMEKYWPLSIENSSDDKICRQLLREE